MQITDEAVEAAAREFYRALSFDSVGPPVRDRWMASARAALEAALPNLLGNPVAWRYRHVPYVGWSYASTKPLRDDLAVDPLYANPTKSGEA